MNSVKISDIIKIYIIFILKKSRDTLHTVIPMDCQNYPSITILKHENVLD